MIKPGTKGTYHSEHGPLVAWVTENEAGRAEGDHLVSGFTNEAARKAGAGDVFHAWTQIGSDPGQFTPAK